MDNDRGCSQKGKGYDWVPADSTSDENILTINKNGEDQALPVKYKSKTNTYPENVWKGLRHSRHQKYHLFQNKKLQSLHYLWYDCFEYVPCQVCLLQLRWAQSPATWPWQSWFPAADTPYRIIRLKRVTILRTKVFGTIVLHVRVGEGRNHVKITFLRNSAVSDRLLKSPIKSILRVPPPLKGRFFRSIAQPHSTLQRMKRSPTRQKSNKPKSWLLWWLNKTLNKTGASCLHRTSKAVAQNLHHSDNWLKRYSARWYAPRVRKRSVMQCFTRCDALVSGKTAFYSNDKRAGINLGKDQWAASTGSPPSKVLKVINYEASSY